MGNLCNRLKEAKYSGDYSGSAGDMGVADSHHHSDLASPTDYRPHIHSDAVTTVAAVRPGVCVSGSKDKTVVLYDFDRGEVLERWVGHDKEVTQVVYAGTSDCVFSCSRDMTIRVWSAATRQSQATFTGHSLVVTAIDLSPDETKLVSGSRDNTVRLWDIETGQQIRHSFISRNLVNTVRWVPDSELVVQAGEDKEVRVFDTRSMDVAFSFPRKQYIQMCADVTPDGLYCLTCSNGFGGSGCEATLWDLRSRGLLTEFRGHTEAVESCAFLPHSLGGGKLFSTSGRDCCLKVWDISTKECVSELSLSGAGPLTSIAPFTEGSICVGSFNSGIQLVSLSTDDCRTLRHTAQF